MLEIKPELKNRIMTHDRAIVAARYLLKQKQVMVVCQGGDVSFWSLEGQKTKRFSEQNATDIFDTTCLGFDEFGEKFYTGGSDGKIRIWNYNGRILQMLDAGRGTAVEITQIDALKRRIVAVGWSKYLTVFRDLQQVEGRPNLPTEWNGEKEKTEGHDDDIVCMAVTAYFPQLLASGSTDGEICIWNTSSELFVRRLDQRKRNPNFSQSKLQDNAADFAISMLKFFDKRMASSVNTHATGANLVSCGGIGFVRFWNVHTGKLIAECQAHTDVSSIIMEIDVHNKYLATGDVNGVVKLWEIEQYCLQSESGTIEKRLPPLLTEFASHSDSITCIDFLEKDERMFILTSSSDCSVVLSDIHGNAYGTFGQPNQWHLDMDLSKLSDSNSQAHLSKSDDYSQQNDEDSHTIISQDLDTMSSITDEEMLTRRSNVWESTSIGVTFQEKRTNRRQRNQPSLITKKDFLLWEKTGLAPGGAYGALDTYEPPPIPDQKKSNYHDTTYIWQANNAGEGNRRRPLPTMIGENLKSAFDERSIFPKYILDYEAKQKQLFESGVQQPTINMVPTGGNNANSQQLARSTGDAVVKFKRQSSSSTLLSDTKAQ
ncbi:unnamed protein product [Rotaria socialis]|uniref:Uncharacterized protein n=5 Tax=Rotaria socialis TaxID=392032 RepID=A0A817Y150_9BILA|nr:unnamed protein product [Rotaria socialis]CAF4598341.1 unnamed protein product [Rotaria socialis]